MLNKFTPKRISAIISSLIGFGIIGLYQLAQLGFDATMYTASSFWINLGYRLALKLMFLKIGMDFRFDTNASSFDNVLEKERYTQLNDLKKIDFDKYLDEYNYEVKTKYYKLSMRKKIDKLKKKKDKAKIQDLKDAFQLKIDELEKDIDLKNVKVKYPETYSSHFAVDEIDTESLDNDYKIKPQYNKRVASVGAKGLLSSAVISILFGSIVYEFNINQDATFWINMLFNLFIITSAFIEGVYKSKSIYDSEYKKSYSTRIKVLKKYYNWSSIANVDFDTEILNVTNRVKDEFEARNQKIEADKIKVNIYGQTSK